MLQRVCAPARPSCIVKRSYEKKVSAKKYAKADFQGGDTPKVTSAYKRRIWSPQGTVSDNVGLSGEIKALNAGGDYHKAMAVWKAAREKSLDIDQYAYATILSTYRHQQDFDGALGLYTEIKEKGISNSFIDSQIVDVYARKGMIQEAIDMMYGMLSQGMEVKTYAFFSVIKALIANGNIDEAIGMITQHSPAFAQSEKSFWVVLINTVLSTENNEISEFLLQHILDSDIIIPQTSYLSLLHYFSRKESTRSKELFTKLIETLKLGGAAGLSTLIAFHTERNDSQAALEVWEQLKTQPKFFSASAFSHLITVCASSGHLEQVESIYKSMKDSGIEANSAIRAALIRLYAANMRVDDARSHFDALLSQPSYVSPFLFNTMLDMYADMGDADLAMEIVQKMKDRRMKLNTSTYNSLINLYLNLNQPALALEQYGAMKKEKVPLNFLTYKVLLSAPTNAKKSSLFNEIKASTTISGVGKSILIQQYSNL